MHIFCLDYTVSVSKNYPLRVQNKLTTSILDAGYPPLRISRFFTFEGAAVMDGRGTEICIPPRLL